MPEQELPQTAQFYLIERIAALDPHARLVCVLDPQRQLDLGASLQTNNKLWQVICYTGNDLKFRSDYSVIDGQPLLIWLTQQDSWHPEQPETLKLSSLADVLTQADAILDLSLRGVLGMLIPGETWPHAALNTQTPILSRHLPEVVNGYKSIRRYLPPAAALDASVVRAIVLHCIHPSIPAHEFLFQQDSAGGVLTQYVNLVWGSIWDETATGILREQARLAPRCEVTSIIPWLDAPADGLARYLCLYRLFSQARLPNVANQLRGLGLLGFDPQALEPRLGNVLARWDRDVIWHERIIQQAESILTLADTAALLRY
jgi:hypothetical protein